MVSSPDLLRRLAALSGGNFAAAHGAFGNAAGSAPATSSPIARAGSGVPSTAPIGRSGSGVPNMSPLIGPPGAVQPTPSVEPSVAPVGDPLLINLGAATDSVAPSAAEPADELSAALAGLDFNAGAAAEPNGPFAPLTADELYSMLSTEDTASVTLVLDTRERKEYQTSHLVASGHNITMLNIPESWLVKGVDPTMISNKLRKEGAKRTFNMRDAYQTVAVIPGTCTDPNDPDGPLAHLLDALVTYAADALLQQKPQLV